ncbi:MAG: hypothetical protein PHP66_04490 [Syntrophales bacterium]|nr:hypothetical protein [Syntrophales bacterium]
MKMYKRPLWPLFLLASLLILVQSQPVDAQTYTISGRVTDS